MPAPENRFKAALQQRRTQLGLWLALANSYTAEVCAGAGYDWLLIDGEHAPNDIPLIMTQLQAMRGSTSHPVVRIPVGETWLIKQVLDIGAQSVLVPMVESADQARALVRAMRYPPDGIRGIGAALARASDFGRVADYLPTANREVCLLVQVETRKGVDAIEAICGVEGVDGVFVGPSDLAADLGFIGRPGVPEVNAVVEEALRRIHAAGKPSGILTGDQTLAKRYVELGSTFVAIGNDVSLFGGAVSGLLKNFKASLG